MNPPESLPLLRAGTHLSPDDGACLMELVCVLSGQRWSDQPTCTDPTLATIARVVNDEMSDTARQGLAPLAADLVGRRADPTWLAPRLVDTCLTVAQHHLPRPVPALQRHRRRATRRLARQSRPPDWLSKVSAVLYRRGASQHAIAAAVLALRTLPTQARDHALRAILDAAITATPWTARTASRTTAEAPTQGRSGRTGPQRAAVELTS